MADEPGLKATVETQNLALLYKVRGTFSSITVFHFGSIC